MTEKIYAKEALEEINEEEFVSWIKLRKNRALLNIEFNQERIGNTSDEAVLVSWMKTLKDVDLVEAQNSLSLKTKQETLNLVIEVASEASIHFFIQVLLVLPDLILTIFQSSTLQISYFEKAKELVNWKVLSILSSFAAMANSYSKIQILEKENALSWTKKPSSLFLLFIFTTINTVSRTMVFGCFVYFTNTDGHFDIWKAVSIYYGHVLIMIFFNIVFNRSSPAFSSKYIISLLLNSMTSFYSYNYYNFYELRNEMTIKHKPTFLRQLFYFLITMTENIALIAYFALYSSSYKIENSHVHQLLGSQVISIVILIIILQIVSNTFKCIYYGSHPASVSLTDLKQKMQIDVLGTSWVHKKGRWVKEKKEITFTDVGITKIGTSLLELC